MGLIKKSNINDFEHPSILWGIDGNFDLNYMPADERFATTNHCGPIQILDKKIVPEYLLYAVDARKDEESFDRSFAGLTDKYRALCYRIPILDDGTFDVKTQEQIAERFVVAPAEKDKVLKIKTQLNKITERYLI